jgi:hypothetical protein
MHSEGKEIRASNEGRAATQEYATSVDVFCSDIDQRTADSFGILSIAEPAHLENRIPVTVKYQWRPCQLRDYALWRSERWTRAAGYLLNARLNTSTRRIQRFCRPNAAYKGDSEYEEDQCKGRP